MWEGGGKEKAEVFGWYLVPTEHKMVDMSILLRAGATVEAVDKSGKIVEDTYWCTCHQVCAMGLAMWCSSMCNKGCNKVPYRAPYRAIRRRDKVPYRAPYRAVLWLIEVQNLVTSVVVGCGWSVVASCGHPNVRPLERWCKW